MSFTWSAYSGFHLVLDGLIVATFAALFFFARKWGPWASLILAWVVTVLLWGFIGGRFMGFFFIARLLWIVSSVALPAGMLFWWRWTGRKGWLITALLMLGFKFYGEFVEPRRLEVTRVTFRSSKVLRPIRVVHISDFQTDGLTDMYFRAREAANAFDPDIVAFTGDLANHPGVLPSVETYLKGFHHREGAFLVGGNIDRGLDLDAIAQCTGFENIEGKAHRLIMQGSSITVMGLGIQEAHLRSSLRALTKSVVGGDFVLLLSHFPDALFTAQREPVDLMLSGHTHGGQVCLPFFGPVVTLSSVPREVAAGGLHKVGTIWILVSRGMGWEGHVAPRVRAFCRPQVVLLDIVPDNDGGR